MKARCTGEEPALCCWLSAVTDTGNPLMLTTSCWLAPTNSYGDKAVGGKPVKLGRSSKV